MDPFVLVHARVRAGRAVLGAPSGAGNPTLEGLFGSRRAHIAPHRHARSAWLCGSGVPELSPPKPVAVVRAAHASRGAKGNAALRLVLSALSAEVFDDLVLSVPVDPTQLGASGELRPNELEGVRRAVAAFACWLQPARVASQPRL